MSSSELQQTLQEGVDKGRFSQSVLEWTRTLAVTECPSYNDLARTVGGWADEYLQEATSWLLARARGVPSSDSDLPFDTPFVLLLMKSHLDGRLPLRMKTEPPLREEEQEALLRQFFTAIVADTVRALYTWAFHHGGIATLPDLIERGIPSECLVPEALSLLTADCSGWSTTFLSHPDQFDAAFRHEYINAAAYAVARLPNPRRAKWAEFVFGTFLLSRLGNVVLPDAFLLNQSVLKRTVTFENAWNLAVRDVKPSDTESLDTARDFFRHIGWLDRFEAEFLRGPIVAWLDPNDPRGDAEVVNGALGALEESIAAHQLAEDPDLPAMRGLAIRVFMATFLDSGRRGAARLLAVRAVDKSAARGDWRAVGEVTIDCARTFNERRWYDDAAALLARHYDSLYKQAKQLPCSLVVGLLVERGNVMRYLRRSSSALEAYDSATELATNCRGLSEASSFAIDRNRAIVLREMGRVDDAVRLFEELLAKTPDSDAYERLNICLSLALTYLGVNRPDLALEFAALACATQVSPHENQLRINALIAHADARARLDPKASLDDFAEAFELARHEDHLRIQVASAALTMARKGNVPTAVIDQAVKILNDRLTNLAALPLDDVLVSAVVALGAWYADHGRREQATALVVSLFDRGKERVSWPWQFLYLRARLLPDNEVLERWELMQAALEDVEQDVPDAAGVAFTTTWMTDKSAFQSDLLASVKEAIRKRVAAPEAAVRVFEFLNAREIPHLEPATATQARAIRTKDIVDELRTCVPDGQRVRIFIFLEDDDDVEVVTLNLASAQPRMLDARVSAAGPPSARCEPSRWLTTARAQLDQLCSEPGSAPSDDLRSTDSCRRRGREASHCPGRESV